MPVLADFTTMEKVQVVNGKETIVGTFEHPYTVGGSKRFEHVFNTGGRHHAPGLLTMMVRNLTQGSARVAIKGVQNFEVTIGRLQPSAAADNSLWRHQQFIIPTNVLTSGDNLLVVGRILDGDGDLLDTFQIRDIVCFFHQRS